MLEELLHGLHFVALELVLVGLLGGGCGEWEQVAGRAADGAVAGRVDDGFVGLGTRRGRRILLCFVATLRVGLLALEIVGLNRAGMVAVRQLIEVLFVHSRSHIRVVSLGRQVELVVLVFGVMLTLRTLVVGIGMRALNATEVVGVLPLQEVITLDLSSGGGVVTIVEILFQVQVVVLGTVVR